MTGGATSSAQSASGSYLNELALLTPGVVNATNLRLRKSMAPEATSDISADGAGRYNNEFQIDGISNTAADRGRGYARVAFNNSAINLHTMEAARHNGVRKYLYTSSACVYLEYLQTEADLKALKEEDAYPAQPQDAYGSEKLISERLCTHYREDYGIETYIVRFHNIFGPLGTWDGGREKAPAAVCRKVATAKLTANPEVEIWGDSEQTRSFCYIDDCVEGIYRLMNSSHYEPLNLGQDRLISINDLARLVSSIAGIEVSLKHVLGPMGVRGRNSDNNRLRQVLGWEPQITLEEGLRRTYAWIEEQVRAKLGSAIVST